MVNIFYSEWMKTMMSLFSPLTSYLLKGGFTIPKPALSVPQ